MKIFESFLVGVFAALGALLLEIILDAAFAQWGISGLSLIALAAFVLAEELAKWIVIRLKVDLQASPRTILSQCFWIGTGFGLLELGILMLNGSATFSGNTLAILAVILVHLLTTLSTGLVLKGLRNKGYLSVLAIVPALILHLAFNYFVLNGLN